MIILDFGSGATSKNDVTIVRRMIDELAAVDTGKHTVVIKWQLFTDCPPNIPLQLDVFDYAYNYAKGKGYQTTASVFDMDSLQFLLTYDIPFIKLANRPDLYWLAGEVPRKIPVYASVGGGHGRAIVLYGQEVLDENIDVLLSCVSEYPATVEEYEKWFTFDGGDVKFPPGFSGGHALYYVSDHTTDFTLYHKYKPSIYECHYKLNDSTGPDAGPFARTPDQLKEIL